MVKARSMEIVLHDHIQGRIHVESKSGQNSASTYMTRNAHVIRHLYMDFHVAIS